MCLLRAAAAVWLPNPLTAQYEAAVGEGGFPASYDAGRSNSHTRNTKTPEQAARDPLCRAGEWRSGGGGAEFGILRARLSHRASGSGENLGCFRGTVGEGTRASASRRGQPLSVHGNEAANRRPEPA